MVRSDLGKVGAALSAGMTAAANINFGPLMTIDVINNQNNKITNDKHNNIAVEGLFLAGISKCGSVNARISK